MSLHQPVVHDRFVVSGGGEIRTHGTFSGTPVFKTGPLDHSGTPPEFGGIVDSRVGGRHERGIGVESIFWGNRLVVGEYLE